MKRIGLLKKIVLFIIVFVIFLSLSGCATADVCFKENGVGTATIMIEKTNDLTQNNVREKINEIFIGIEALSKDKNRVSLKSLQESEKYFTAKISFKNISKTSGVGNFNYGKAKDYLSELNNKSLIKKWSLGKYDSLQIYNQSTYSFDSQPNSTLAFKPLDVKNNYKELEVDNFISEDSILVKNDKGIMFTYFIAGLNIDKISFSFNGKIQIVGGKNLNLIDEDTIEVTPLEITASVLKLVNDGNGGEIAEKVTEDTSVYAGYVYFVPRVNLLPIIAGVIVIISFIVLLTLGFVKGYFKRIISGRKFKTFIKNYELYIMLIPAFVLLLIFNYIPMSGVIIAFKNFNVEDGIWGSEWVGFRNFVDVITDPGTKFWMLAKNTVFLALLKFVFGFTLTIGLAILFSYLKKGIFKKTVQTISYFPYFISWVVISGIAYLFLSTDGGILNKILTGLGLDSIKWYSEPKYWPTILTATSLWKTIGYGTIVYLAGISSINPSLYEAAVIDGAGRGKQLFYITLPGLFPIIGIQMVFSLGNLVKDDFDQIYTMTGGNNSYLTSTTEVIGTVIYKAIGNISSYGTATAMGLFQSVLSLILVLSSNKLVKKMDMDALF